MIYPHDTDEDEADTALIFCPLHNTSVPGEYAKQRRYDGRSSVRLLL
jgi:hypothetical protein